MEVFYGVVVDNNDPSKTGRVKVKIRGEHNNTSDVDTLPWSEVMQSASNGLLNGVGFSKVLQVGTWVYLVKLSDTESRYLVIGTCTGLSENTSDYGHCSIKDDIPKDTTQTTKGTSFEYESTVNSNKYTSSQIYRSESGLMVEFDDSETMLKITHPSGSVIELDSNGDITITSLNNTYINSRKDLYLNVKGDYHLNVDGNTFTDVKGNSSVGIQGSVKESINGAKSYQIKGDINCIGNSSISWNVSNNVLWNVSNNVNINCSDGLVHNVNVITKQGVNLDKHVHGGVDRGRSDTNRAEDSV